MVLLVFGSHVVPLQQELSVSEKNLFCPCASLRRFRCWRLARMISAFEVCFDLLEREPGGFKLCLRIELGLIEVMLRLRIMPLAELQQRTCLDLRSEFYDAHERMADLSVEPFQPFGDRR